MWCPADSAKTVSAKTYSAKNRFGESLFGERRFGENMKMLYLNVIHEFYTK
jgi:hypothetical protein